MVQRIAVAVDDSPASQAAMAWACQLAEPGGTVVGIAIKDMVTFYQEYSTEAYLGAIVTRQAEQDWDIRTAELATHLQALGVAHNIATDWHVVPVTAGEGLPAARFLSVAHEHSVDLVVVGQHRNTHQTAELFHTFSRYVVAHSRVPIVVVPDPHHTAASPGATP